MHDADVIDSPDNPRLARAECGGCGWQGPNRRWWATALSDADAHMHRPEPHDSGSER